MSKACNVTIIGSGSWGCAIAHMLARAGHNCLIWARDPEVAEAIQHEHINPHQLSDYTLHQNICATHDICEATASSDVTIIAVPSGYLRSTLSRFKGKLHTPCILLTKGIEEGTHLRMSEVLKEALDHTHTCAVLSGPNHAEEIIQGKFSAATLAAPSLGEAQSLKTLFDDTALRVYGSDDLVGVEICAALKNVIALACGIAAGLRAGDNAQAVLMTRGLAEIARLATTLGSHQLTPMGLSGMGDLVATCTSPHSRNRSFGVALCEGAELRTWEETHHMVVEGAHTARSACELAQIHGVELPITEGIYRILYEKAPVHEAYQTLIQRYADLEFYSPQRRKVSYE